MTDVSWDDFYVVRCANCTLLFAVTKDFRDVRMHDHNRIWCPNGCSNHWAPSDASTGAEVLDLKDMILMLRAKITHLEDENEMLSRGLREEPRGIHAKPPQNDT